MGFGPFSSDSSASDERIAATDYAQVVRGSGTITSPYSILISKGAVGKGATLTIGDGGQTVAELAGRFATGLQNLSTQSQTTLESALNAQAETVRSALGQVSDLSQSSQTGGASAAGKMFLWLALGGLALLAVIAFVMKK